MVNERVGLACSQDHFIAFNLHTRLGIVLACTRLQNEEVSVKMIAPARNASNCRWPTLGSGPCSRRTVRIIPHIERLLHRLLIDSDPLPRPHQTGFCADDAVGGVESAACKQERQQSDSER